MADFIEVRVGKVPGKVEQFALNGTRTVKAALETAGISTSGLAGYEVRVNNAVATLETNLSAGDTVLVVKQVKGA